MRRANRIASARQTARVALSLRVRQAAMAAIVVVLRARRASMPRSTVRSSAVSALTAGAFAAHLFASRCQDAQGCAITAGPWPAQFVDVEAASCLGHRDGVHDVALATATPGGGRNVGGFGDGQAGCRKLLGEGGAVGTGAVDNDQRRRLVGVALDPVDGTAQPCRGGRELSLLPECAGASGDQGERVGGDVGVHADDEVVLVCDDGHCGVLPSRGDVVTASAREICVLSRQDCDEPRSAAADRASF